ncbi:hypothetical protein [Paenibacillus sp. BT-177]|uniref:hypothetical protein n=1 Tax=Paenibacillus sp. BT-177 TaxID=2986930 RepID=UPI0021F6D264|nr:hypothetical protein [Paenibacillus sp. BT-177]
MPSLRDIRVRIHTGRCFVKQLVSLARYGTLTSKHGYTTAGLTKMPYLGLIVACRKYYSSSSFALRENYAEH